jgi:hypothetical protein
LGDCLKAPNATNTIIISNNLLYEEIKYHIR